MYNQWFMSGVLEACIVDICDFIPTEATASINKWGAKLQYGN